MLVLIRKNAQQRTMRPTGLSRRRWLKPFSLKSLFFMVAVLAVLLATLPRGYRYLSTYSTRQSLVEWARKAQNNPGVSEFATDLGAHGSFFVVNAQLEWLTLPDGREGWVVPGDAKKSPDGRFFIVPPGKWVNSVDEIIDGWLEHPDGQRDFETKKTK